MARIALLLRDLDNPGGAEESLLTLKDHLKTAHDHDAHVFGFGDLIDGREITTASIIAKRRDLLPVGLGSLGRYVEGFIRFFRNVESFDPDLIISQHELALVGARIHANTETPHVVFIRDFEQCGTVVDAGRSSAGKLIEHATWPVTKPIVRYIMGNSTEVVANSDFIASVYGEYWDIDPHVIYPFVETSNYEVGNTGDAILHVNPSRHKGIQITLDVADKLRDQEFLIVGNEGSTQIQMRIESLPNVSFKGYVEDMRDIYRQCKLVLMPSQWPEPYGRIPIEAGISGIPTICSNSGGLPESVGIQDCVVDSSEPSDYITRIRHILDDYDEFSKRAKRNAEEKNADSGLFAFDALLDPILHSL
jgi:glycosyltransferase involved in cell wall biosynthesis